jgi:hypothetical protein
MIQKLVNMFGELVFIGTKVEWWRFRFETVGQVHEMYLVIKKFILLKVV